MKMIVEGTGDRGDAGQSGSEGQVYVWVIRGRGRWVVVWVLCSGRRVEWGRDGGVREEAVLG